jgi:chemotaxis protein CheX
MPEPGLKAEYVNPFIAGVHELMSAMLGAKVRRSGISVSDGSRTPYDTVAMIGMSGKLKGTIALSLPDQTCKGMVERMLGATFEMEDPMISDAIAEMVNIIGGAAKAKISLLIGSTLDLTLPTVLRGESFEVYSPSKAVWLELPFKSELGDFTLMLTFSST